MITQVMIPADREQQVTFEMPVYKIDNRGLSCSVNTRIKSYQSKAREDVSFEKMIDLYEAYMLRWGMSIELLMELGGVRRFRGF